MFDSDKAWICGLLGHETAVRFEYPQPSLRRWMFSPRSILMSEEKVTSGENLASIQLLCA
jgi:hypothetical protein